MKLLFFCVCTYVTVLSIQLAEKNEDSSFIPYPITISQNEVVCQTTSFKPALRCSNGYVIRVTAARWGNPVPDNSNDINTSGDSVISVIATQCKVEVPTAHDNICPPVDVLKKMGRQCDGKNLCGESDFFAGLNKKDPCKGKDKYLIATYQCLAPVVTTAPVCGVKRKDIKCLDSWRNFGFVYVRDVFYGRFGNHDDYVCSVGPKPFKNSNACSVKTNSFVKAKKACNGKNVCTVGVTTYNIKGATTSLDAQDPVPNKCVLNPAPYFTASYQCVHPAAFACDNSDILLKCPSTFGIEILAATYGRYNTRTCPNNQDNDRKLTNCGIATSSKLPQELQAECGWNRRQCEITAQVWKNMVSVAGENTCGEDTSSYLSIQYTCGPIGSESPLEEYDPSDGHN